MAASGLNRARPGIAKNEKAKAKIIEAGPCNNDRQEYGAAGNFQKREKLNDDEREDKKG
jgi:hypothetical protein